MTETFEGAADEGRVEDGPRAEPMLEDALASAGEAHPDEVVVVAEARPPRKSARERIDELTAARRSAERDAAYWREEAMRREPIYEPSPYEAPEAYHAGPGRYDQGPFDDPYGDDPHGYDPYEGYDDQAFGDDDGLGFYGHDEDDEPYDSYDEGGIDALLAWQAEQQAQTAHAVEHRWAQSQADTARRRADFHEVLHGHPWPCTEEMAAAIKTSEAGGDVAYHLASHPDEARRIAALPPLSQVREIGRLEAALSAGPWRANTVTRAPEPAPQALGSGSRFRVAPDTDDFAAFDKAYG